MARAATSEELTLYRTSGKASKLYAAIHAPRTVFTARINQAFSDTDGVLEITYDGGVGTLSDVLPDMTLLVGSSAGAHDKGITRMRSIDGTKFYIGETSDVEFANDQYLTVLEDFSLWAKHVLIDAGTAYMDGGVSYSDQHSNPDPTPIMGANRVLKLEGADVSAQFTGSASYVIGALSTISAYAWSAPTASGITGETTATPTITFDETGFHPVYLTLTTAGGETFFGVRWVYVWSEAAPPPSCVINSARGDVESGGWEFDLTLFTDADLATVRDHALVIVFSEDWYGDTKQSIGPVAGSENVLVTGWIARESINWNPEAGAVRFTGYTAHHWLQKIPSFPDGVEFVTGTPAAWTEFQNLTVDRGLWHMLHWRTTATRVMDVILTGDTKYTKEVSSLASSLWEQVREMSFLQIYARALVNAHNQLYVEVHPQLVPAGSRSWPTVMTITTADWQEEIDFERVTLAEVAVVSLSGVAVNSAGVGSAFFSLSPGHAYPRFGTIDVQDHLLVESQSQANGLAGLYRAWRNNPYPEIPVRLAADIRLIDICPRQTCTIAIAETDTPRGISYSGDLVPSAVSIVTDPETGALHREVSFEAETFQDLAVNGDIPGGRADPSIPPTPGLPRLPSFPIILPGTIEPSADGATAVLLHDTAAGLVFTENFDSSSPTWRTVNAGLTLTQAQRINFIGIGSTGVVYVGNCREGNSGEDLWSFIARAPSIGATFVVQTLPSPINSLLAIAINPLVEDTIAFWGSQFSSPFHSNLQIFVGGNDDFDAGVALAAFGSGGNHGADMMTYGFGYWIVTQFNAFRKIAPGGGSIVASGSPSVVPRHLRAGTTGITFHEKNAGNAVIKGEENLATATEVSTGAGILFGPSLQPVCADVDATGMYLMARGTTALTKFRSSDGGVTWVTIPNLAAGNWFFRNAGAPSRWIAAAGSVGYSDDFGDGWSNKTGNLTGVAPTPAIDMVRVLEA